MVEKVKTSPDKPRARAAGNTPTRADEAVNAKPTLVLQKTRRLLDVFTTASPELTLSQIREATGLPATTCARLVQNLVQEGLLTRTGDRYGIGLAVLRWSAAALRRIDLASTLTPVIEQLRDVTGESAAVYVRQELNRTCVAVAPTRHRVIWQLQIGMVTPLYVGSGARAILAFDPEATAEVLASSREGFTRHTLVDAERLRAALARTRETGIAVSEQELDTDVAGVSAPVLGADGQVIASIGVAGPSQRFHPDQVAEYTQAVLAAARTASHEMGGSFPF